MPRQQEEYGSEHGLRRHDQGPGSFIGTVLSGRRLLGDRATNTLLDEPTMLAFGQRLGMTAQFVPSPMGHKLCVYMKP